MEEREQEDESAEDVEGGDDVDGSDRFGDDGRGLDIGSTKNGREVVCHGDYRPQSFADWLEPMVGELETLSEIAQAHALRIDVRGVQLDGSAEAFLSAIGVDLVGAEWTGSLISGTYYFGWIAHGGEGGVVHTANRLLAQLREELRAELREILLEQISEELAAIDDIATLSERVRKRRKRRKS